MDRKIANTVISLVAFMAMVLGLFLYRFNAPGPMTNEQLRENGLFVYDLPRRFRDFNLSDHRGQPFNRQSLQGKWTLMFFGYTYCPDVCPLTLATISRFSEFLTETPYAGEVQVVMVSVDPMRDTTEKLAQYVTYFNPDYLGVNGEYIDIFNLASQLNIAFAYEPSDEAGNYLVSHSGEVVLINPNGHHHGFFKAPHDPQKMLDNFVALRERPPGY